MARPAERLRLQEVDTVTYTPKPGDRVTSPLLVGEWEVMFVLGQQCMVVTSGLPSSRAAVPTDSITPVAPSLPPEPAVGSVVRAHGRLWHSKADFWHTSLGDVPKKWADLAAAPDLSPVVPVDDAAEWLEKQQHKPYMVEPFRDEFGGWDK